MLGIRWKKPWNGFNIWLHHNSLWTILRYNSVTCERRYGKMSFKCICKSKWLRIKETFLKKKYKVKELFFFVFLFFFKSEINNLLCISVSSVGLGLGAGVYTLTNKIEKRAQMQTYTKNGNSTYDWDNIDTAHWLGKDKLFTKCYWDDW